MKTIKYIFAIICLFSFVGGGFSSCTDEIEKKDNAGTGIANSLQLQLTIPDNEEIAPMTKSSQSESEGVNDLSILIYEVQDGSLAEHFYYSAGQLQGLTTDEKFIKIDLTQIAPGQKRVYLIANIGSESAYNTLCGQVRTENELKAYSVGLNGTKPAMLLAAQGDRDFDAQTGAQVSASLKRIYSMITVKVVRNLKDGLVINPKSVQLKHVPTTGFLFKDNKIENEDQCKTDGEMIERTGGNTNFLTDDHATASALYMFENRQPDGSNGGDQTTKTPAGLKPDALIESIKTDRKCSYIEVVADYLKGGQSGVSGSGTITYRFFLGKDALKDFDVQRNVHYLVTLTLNGDGGKDEATWRVETDLMNEINVSDIYISYLDASTGTITVTANGGGDLRSLSLSNSTDNDIRLEGPYGTGNTRTFKATAGKTNLMQDAYNVASFRINATFTDGKTDSKTVRVHQVSRLVDPIAIYKRASNVDPVEVKVKEFTRGDKDYHVLNSDGPWSVEIEQGDWYTISANGTTVNTQGGKISSLENEVRFTYTPKSKNTGNEARYGVVLVKYHNYNCEHRIYLRQGYQLTVMPGSSVAWSMFNCIGDGNNGQEIAEYPTQTGYFYLPGRNTHYHPFDPGFGVSLSQSSDYRSNTSFNVYAWTSNNSTPCPDGYKLPEAADYTKIAENNNLYQGFVHDDDPESGWSRNANGSITLQEGVHCNPAKGTLFVDPATGKSLFFSYGKGVLTSHDQSYEEGKRVSPTDINLDEIGVGLRLKPDAGGDGKLMYKLGDASSNRYGAIYHTSTQSDNMQGSVKAMDLWYDMTSPDKNGNVIWNPSERAGGFVRCVRSGSGSGGGETTVTFKPSATFKYGYGNNITGTITVSYDNGRKTATFSVLNGKAIDSLTLPSSVTSVDLSYKGDWYTYKISNVSVADLRSSSLITLTR